MQKSRVFRKWWEQQPPEEQQTVQQQHSNIDLLKLISQLRLPSSRVDSKRDIAGCVSAVEQLYWQVLPAKETQPAVDVWMQSPRLQPHVSQITRHVDTAVAPASAAAAAAAQPGDAAATSAAAAAPRLQPDIAPAAAAEAVTPAAADPQEYVRLLQEGGIAPAVLAVPEPFERVHEDPSPGSAQPSRKQKGAAGLAVPKQHAAAGPSAAAAADKFDIRDAAWRRRLGHTPAADFLHGGTQCVEQLLKDKGLQAVIDMGLASQEALGSMQSNRWVKFEYKKFIQNQPPATEWTRAGRKGTAIRKWGAKLLLNYGGHHLEQQQWERMGEHLEDTWPSSEAVSNAVSFEDGFDIPALVVESGFELKSNATGCVCKSRGDGLRISVDSSSATELATFREAAFWVTVLLLLLWHSQNKQTHPALQQVAMQYNLKAEKPGSFSELQTSTQLGRQCMQAQMAGQRLSSEMQN